MQKYNHKKIEDKWQKYWAGHPELNTADDKTKAEKKYILDMFPYPSGDGLHVGHVESYTATDIMSRYLRLNGKNVLHPQGWDAFGLPAENYAVKTKIHPAETTKKAIATFKKQMNSMGFSYDWSREVNSSDPAYYKWTQWLFLQFYKNGLAYKKKAKVNWCDKCQTVLANEQAEGGICERCKNEVVQKDMEQWFFKITDFIENKDKTSGLLDGLNKVDWPESTKAAQRNWIGKSEGAEVDFRIKNSGAEIKRFIILHGRNGSPDNYLFPWLKAELEKRGYEVQVPALPNTDEPDDQEQASFVLKGCQLDENTAIMGHSFGGIVALRLLEMGVKVNSVVLASVPFSGEFLDKKPRLSVTKACKKGFDFKTIKANAKNFSLIYDTSDEIVPLSEGEAFAKNLNAGLIKAKGVVPHFSADEEPEILNACLPSIRVYTTRVDTIFGCTYMVVAPEHRAIERYKSQIKNYKEVEKYLEQAKRKTDLERMESKEKTGVKLEGVAAINPFNNEAVPIFAADYVLAQYGTGAVMAVPAHDERDWEFAKKYNLEIKEVIKGVDGKSTIYKQAFIDDGILVNSEKYSGLASSEAREKLTAWLEKQGLGKKQINYKMRDWLVSRQRYWGAPIPIIYCAKCGEVAVPEKDLPVRLPDDVDFMPTGESPLVKSKSFHKVKCPKCGGAARRESDTMDTFVCSSWYYLRYSDPNDDKEFASPKMLKQWLPVDLYVGGAEHTVLHLLYARFFTKVLHHLGYLNFDEPFLKLRHQGIILAEDGRKMSKSFGNVINPDDVVKQCGADALRMFEMFMGPLEDMKPWNTRGIIGIRRFLESVYKLKEKKLYDCRGGDCEMKKLGLPRLMHKTIKKVSEDIENLRYNTAIAQLMIFLNFLSKLKELPRGVYENFLKLLAPLAPHLAEELWQGLGNEESIFKQSWPKYNSDLIKDETINLVVQINGKVRDMIAVPADLGEAEAKKVALGSEKIKKWLENKEPKKVIYVKGRLVNIVA